MSEQPPVAAECRIVRIVGENLSGTVVRANHHRWERAADGYDGYYCVYCLGRIRGRAELGAWIERSTRSSA